nr:GIY-YIG nuclease family protein [Dictyobacter kobayashii]
MNSSLYYVYIVRCGDGTLYTGYTTNIARRLAMHNAGKGARYTRARLPVVLVANWEFASKSEALRIEYALKRWPRVQKLRLIENPTLITLLISPQPEIE